MSHVSFSLSSDTSSLLSELTIRASQIGRTWLRLWALFAPGIKSIGLRMIWMRKKEKENHTSESLTRASRFKRRRREVGRS